MDGDCSTCEGNEKRMNILVLMMMMILFSEARQLPGQSWGSKHRGCDNLLATRPHCTPQSEHGTQLECLLAEQYRSTRK
jgi:hypothetical protein